MGALAVLFFAAPLTVVLLCAAAVRAGRVPWPLLVVAAAFLVPEFVPTPFGELPALMAGLVAFAWLALEAFPASGAVARVPLRWPRTDRGVATRRGGH